MFLFFLLIFFFSSRRRHTRYIGDWSSDVCSSDLNAGKKKVVLELGGNAGVIVHSDADVSYAAERCVAGGFGYAGQTCISVQRILVERSAYGKFTDALLAGVKKLKMGDPLEETTDVGPLIRESDAARAAAWVQEAVSGGARLLGGGT